MLFPNFDKWHANKRQNAKKWAGAMSRTHGHVQDTYKDTYKDTYTDTYKDTYKDIYTPCPRHI